VGRAKCKGKNTGKKIGNRTSSLCKLGKGLVFPGGKKKGEARTIKKKKTSFGSEEKAAHCGPEGGQQGVTQGEGE